VAAGFGPQLGPSSGSSTSPNAKIPYFPAYSARAKKRSEIVKNEHARYPLERFPIDANGHKKSQGTVLQLTTDH
jgi:hypothetical protein